MSTPAPRRAPLPIVARPWFWLLFVGVLFSFPLIKGLGARLPDPPPGIDSAPLEFELPDDSGKLVRRADLGGHLLVITELAYLNAALHDEPLERLRHLRKRLRGLGSAVVFVVMTHGATAEQLTGFVNINTARKPQNVWLVDEDGAVFSALVRQAGAPSAQMLLLDTHGRLRAIYGDDPAELDVLVGTAGVLANWRGADPPPEG
ncbi:MAG: hypothetical protein DHS20C15_28880 [Planctomycetota bacterium]|nr:MAG: hypothetical protein DHS20C15_28880 [Planctomycetota bacterium]